MASNHPTADHSLFTEYLPQVISYLNRCRPPLPGDASPASFTVKPLAQGEYNINFHLSGPKGDAVFRINIASQIDRKDQILYEYNALRLLQRSGVTPIPYHVDDSRTVIDRGILIMEYLPGRPLDYTTDIHAAAKVFSTIHQLEVSAADNHLIRETAPLSLIYRECSGLLDSYLHSPLATPDLAALLREIDRWAAANTAGECYFQEDPYLCIVNTEVNSGNFIVNPHQQTTHLIDWEMPRWGDPSSDLCHFLSPLTTLWKTTYRFDEPATRRFLATYTDHLADAHLRETLNERIRIKMPYVLLRGIAWSSMAWVAYQQDYEGVRNAHTWQTLNRYMDADFIRSLFQPYISRC